MTTKQIVITFIALVLIIAGVLILYRKSRVNNLPVPIATPSIEQQIESKFRGLTIPEDTEHIDLVDVSGGNGMGIATRSEILADLPALPKGQFYRGLLENSSGQMILLGNLTMEKGGWILNYDSSKYPNYNKIIVSVGTKHILEGSF
ncbi:MAG: hypothetical protein ABSC49_00415 [Candidatus Microgenomates bacterium]|jgi:hypothetical protein